MLKGYEAPTDFQYPLSTTRSKKQTARMMREINNSPVTAEHSSSKGNIFWDKFHVKLPHVWGAHFEFRQDQSLELVCIDVNDPLLFGRGIGTRLLQSASRHSVDLSPDFTTLVAGSVRLGMANTAIKVFGRENVSLVFGDSYEFGMGSDRPLEAIFDHRPYRRGESYIIDRLQAKVDRAQAAGWEKPSLHIDGIPTIEQ